MNHASKLFKENNNFTYFMKGTEKALKIMTCLFGAIIVSAVISLGAKANQTDWDNNSSQQEERAKAKAQWREENGIYQANLTEEGEKQARAYVSIKQAEINKE